MLYSIYQPSLSYDDLEICNNAGFYKGGKGLFDDENELLAQQLLEMPNEKLTVYPNPTTGVVTFEYSMKENDKAEIHITDVYGKLVKRSIFTNATKTILNLNDLPPAVYFYLYLVNGVTENTGKIVLIK